LPVYVTGLDLRGIRLMGIDATRSDNPTNRKQQSNRGQVGRYYVGPEAYRLLECGARRAPAMQCPPDLDVQLALVKAVPLSTPIAPP
jgi:hypothetical protein